jgi:ATP-binding cassette, subfamily B, bacterial MsbA
MNSTWQLFRDLLASFWRLRPYLRMGRWRLLSVTLCSFLSAPLEMVGVGLLIPMLSFLSGTAADRERFFQGRYAHYLQDAFPHRGDGFYFAVICGLIVAALLAKNLVLFVGQVLTARLLSRCGMNLRNSLFARLQRAPMAIFESHKSGELSAIFTVESVRTTNALDFLVLFLQRGTITLFMLASVFVISWQVSGVLLVLVAIMATMVGRLHQRLKLRGGERGDVFRRMGGYLNELFAGARVVRATHAQARAEKGFNRISGELETIELRGSMLGAILTPMMETAGVTGAMLILVGAHHFLIQTHKLSASSLMFLGFLLIKLLPMVNQLQGVTGQLAYNFSGVKEVERWLNTPPYPERPFGTRDFMKVEREIRFEEVTYRYPNGTLALDAVTFSVPAGSTVALVGASGSGKSTLAGLLIRLREPSGGRILVDGTDYWEFAPAAWHRRLGVVEQEAFLFHETVADNITFGLDDVPRERLEAALRLAHLDDVINALPKGLDTVIGERGTLLSGGQKQRLAIARAMVRDPQLLLLDEATSALDNVSERQVQEALDEARQGRTSVVIAHRLSTIRNADRIVVLEKGRVVETGTWAELEARPGAFRRLLEATRSEPARET